MSLNVKLCKRFEEIIRTHFVLTEEDYFVVLFLLHLKWIKVNKTESDKCFDKCDTDFGINDSELKQPFIDSLLDWPKRDTIQVIFLSKI